MNTFAIVTFFAQSGLIAVDEFICHRARLLPKWELIGHPLDTFCLWMYFAALLFISPSSQSALVLVSILGLVSCVIITKDEWVHKALSTGFENWLHAMLFIVHPMVVGFYFYEWLQHAPDFMVLLRASFILVGGYFVFQCWSGWRRWPVPND